MKFPCRTLIAFALVCCAVVVCAPPIRAVEGETAREADAANLRALIRDYFAAYAARDPARLLTFWSEKAPERDARRAEAERQFAAVRSFELKVLSVGSLSVEGETARARVRLELSGVDAKPGAPTAASGAQERALAFVKEAGGWKVWRDASAEDELASALLTAKDEQARAGLLAAEPSIKATDLLQPTVRIANRLFVESEYERALAAYGLVRELSALANNRRGLALALMGEGLVHNARDESDRALASYAESMAAAESAKDASTVARALNNIGNVHYKRGDFTAALASYQRSLELQQAAGNDQSVAQALNNIGSVHYEQRDYEQARDYFERSLRLAEKAGDTRGASNTLNNLGDVAREAGDYPEALDYYGRALSASESINFKLGVARTLNNIGGGVYLYQSQARQALEPLRRSVALYESIGEKYGLSIATYNTGRAHYFLGERESALDYAARAVALGRESGNLKAVAQAQTLTGDVLAAANRGAEARRAYEDAINTTEQMRAEAVGGEAQRQRFFENKTAPYEAMVRLLAARGETAQAFAYAERAKARVLLDVLRGGRGDVTKSMSERERADEVRLRGEVTRLNQRVAREDAQTRPDASRLATLRSQLGQARLAYEAFRTALYAAHPALRGQRGEAKPLDAVGAAALLPDARSAALEYAVTEDATYLFVLTRDGGGTPSLKVYTIPVKRADIYERAEAFRQLLAGRGLGFREAASRLYDLLLKPAARDLEGKTSLVVVPDTGLWNLPFQALVNNSGRYVVEDFAVSYASSLSVLGATRELRRGAPGVGARQLLAFGNPSNVSATGASETNPNSLPEAEREVKTLGRLYGGPGSKVFSGSEATETRVKAEAPRSSVIHLASHGVLDAANPLYSHVVLAGGGGEDGMLETWELMQMDLRADLFVLSACETARGRVGAGEGVIGMSWALFIAGVPTVVVSNWQVSSASTTELMLDFHRQLTAPRARVRTADAKAEALRQASLALLKSPDYRHPFYWAGFSLIGDGR